MKDLHSISSRVSTNEKLNEGTKLKNRPFLIGFSLDCAMTYHANL